MARRAATTRLVGYGSNDRQPRGFAGKIDDHGPRTALRAPEVVLGVADRAGPVLQRKCCGGTAKP